jgi:plastocyanin
MTLTWTRKPFGAGLGLAASLFLIVPGCGGKGTESGDAIVVPAPGTNLPTTGSNAPAASPAPTTTTTTAATPSSPAPAAAPSSPAPVAAGGWGTLKGQVTLTGTPPAPKVLEEKGKARKDPEFCAKDAPIMSDRVVVDEATKGLKNVLVYIPKPTAVNPEAKSNAMSAKIEFDQANCVFKPHVLAVKAGTQVEVKNSDPVTHNVNARLKENGISNMLLPPKGAQPKQLNATERTPSEVVCDVHPWMKAYWMVVDSPYFAVTDEKGNFEIKDVPAGTQKVVVWHEAVGFVTAPSGNNVDIKANDTTTNNVAIDAAKIRPE